MATNTGTGAPSLETIGMSRAFGALRALQDVSIQVPAGSFHALLGENGAGKSTLVKCIMGFYTPDRGQLLLDGREATVRNPRDAQALGVGMVYQHFTLVPALTAAENLVVSRADAPSFIDWRERASKAFSTACRSERRSTNPSRAWRREKSRNSRSSNCSILISAFSSWTSRRRY
jgi:ABC-type uncharacterized transport system ATPase subunit